MSALFDGDVDVATILNLCRLWGEWADSRLIYVWGFLLKSFVLIHPGFLQR